MAKVRTQPKNVEIARRARSGAQRLDGRLFRARDRLLLVGGAPDFHRLCRCLETVVRPPPPADAPTPLDLGFGADRISPVTNAELAASARALQKWRKVIADESRVRRHKTADRRKYAAWKEEADRESRRLERIRSLLAEAAPAQDDDDSPYLLEPLARAELDAAVARLSSGFEVDPLWVWYGRIAAWIAGPTAFRRLFGPLERFLPPRRDEAPAGSPGIHSSRVAAAAALCACDGATAPLPGPPFFGGPASHEPDNSYLASRLLDESTRPAYDLLLEALDTFVPPHGSPLGLTRRLLAAGGETRDVAWLVHTLAWRIRQDARIDVRLGALRPIVGTLRAAGAEVGDGEVAGFLRRAAASASCGVVAALAEWLRVLPPAALGEAAAGFLWESLRRAPGLERASPRFRGLLANWASPPPRLARMPDRPPEAPPGVARWLDRLAWYQKLGGKAPALTGSLYDLLRAPQSDAGQIEFLRAKRGRSGLDARETARLLQLETRASREQVDWGKVERKAREVCAITALETLRHLVVSAQDDLWRENVRCPPPAHLTPAQRGELLQWIMTLDDAKRRRFDEVIDSWVRHGAAYREHLDANGEWLARARDAGVDVDAWLHPPPVDIELDGTPVRVEATVDPFRIFLMGSYFDTCLSMDPDQGFNRDAVLANAHDANKAVLFLYGPHGLVLGRKLVCVNPRFGLIGFRAYVARAKEDSVRLERLADAYCGRWARAANLRLRELGMPAALAGLFWYDDGIARWTAAAHAAWNRGRDAALSVTAAAGDVLPLHPEIAAALRQRASACRAVLERPGLRERPEADAFAALAADPGLAEEALALVAREERDVALAELVADLAFSNGGATEGVTALARLRGTAFVEEAMPRVWEGRNLAARLADVLLGLGTAEAAERLVRVLLTPEPVVPAGPWLLAAAARSPEVARALLRALHSPAVPSDWADGCEVEVLAVAERRLGSPLPDPVKGALLRNAIARGGDLTGLAQWLAPFASPADAPDARLLERAYASDWSGNRAAAVLLALRSPFPASLRFLRDHADDDPAALLALALAAPARFAGLVRARAARELRHPALALALAEVEGDEQARGRDDLAALAKVSRDFPACLPLLLSRAWTALDAAGGLPLAEAIVTGRLSLSPARAFATTGSIQASGVACRLAQALAAADGERRAVLRRALLHTVFPSADAHADAAEVAAIDYVSGHRLLEEPATAADGRGLWVSDLLGSGAAHLVFFDERGSRRPLAALPWTELLECVFPDDLADAERLAELLAEKCGDQDPVDVYRPVAQVHRLLLRRLARKP